jgi:ribosome-associated translation inhibitor RaiA
MKLLISGHQLGVPRDAQTFLRKHLLTPLRRLHDSPATELEVGFDDARPSKGGVDQHCRLTFRMPGARRSITVESTADDLHAAILDAGKRLKRLVEREVSKQRSTSRSPMHKPLGRSFRSRATKRAIAPDGFPSTL